MDTATRARPASADRVESRHIQQIAVLVIL